MYLDDLLIISKRQLLCFLTQKGIINFDCQINIYSVFLWSAFLQNYFLCWDCWNGDMMPTLDAALLCSSRAGSDLGRESGIIEPLLYISATYLGRVILHSNGKKRLARFDIISDTCHPAPCYFNSNKVFLLLSNQYCNPERGFKLGTWASVSTWIWNMTS